MPPHSLRAPKVRSRSKPYRNSTNRARKKAAQSKGGDRANPRTAQTDVPGNPSRPHFGLLRCVPAGSPLRCFVSCEKFPYRGHKLGGNFHHDLTIHFKCGLVFRDRFLFRLAFVVL